MKNEWDKTKLGTKLREVDRGIVFGLYPGVGKTTATKFTGVQTLHLSPFNKLGEELKKDVFNAITLYKLLGLTQYGTQRNSMHEYDVCDYESIVFDELGLCTIEQLGWIYRYMETHTKTFYATADTDQNKPIQYNINNMDTFQNITKNVCISYFQISLC